MIENHRKLIPDVKTDHSTKASIYASFLRQGTTEEAKNTFRRPPYHKTVAEPKGPVKDDIWDLPDQTIYTFD